MTDTYAPDVQFYGPEEQRMLIERGLCPSCKIATPMDNVTTPNLAALRCRVCTNIWVLAAREYDLTELDPSEVERRFAAAANIAQERR